MLDVGRLRRARRGRRASCAASVLTALVGCGSGSVEADPVQHGGAGGVPDPAEPRAGGGGGAAAGVSTSDAGTAGEDSDGGAPPAEPDPVEPALCELWYREGHGDLYFSYAEPAGPSLAIRAALDGAREEALHEPSRVCIAVPIASRDWVLSFGGAPEGEEYAFLGVPPREGFWLLPATARAGMPWLGIATERVPATHYLELEVSLVAAPEHAQFAAWSTDSLGAPQALLSTHAGLTVHAFPAGRHLHLNWSFSAPGLYELELAVSGRRLSDDAETGSVTSIVRFSVEEE